MLDARADRLAFCQSVPGLHETVAAGDGLKERLAERTGGELFDLVFDATGHAGAMEQSFGWVAHAGTMVFVGIVRTEIRFSDPEFHKREATLKASRNATIGDFHEVLDAIRGGRVQVERLITHRSGLEEAVPRFSEWTRPETGVVKTMIEL